MNLHNQVGMTTSGSSRPSIQTVRELSARYSNWERWGPDDHLGTLNFVTPEHVRAAASLIRSGRAISLQIPLDEKGPNAAAAASTRST